MFEKRIVSTIACLSFLFGAAQAQNLFVLPGANSTNPNVQVFGSTLAPITTLQSGAGSFLVFAKPDGSRYYFVANSGSNTVTSVDLSFGNPKTFSFGTQATAAAMTPDGRYLLVVAGSLHIIDTSTDTDLTPTGILPGTSLTDVAVSLDGFRAFVLGSDSGGHGLLYSIDLTRPNFPVAGSLPFTGNLQNVVYNVTVGPNDLVYVSGQYHVYEINPATTALTPAGDIPVFVARVGKLAFTPDGKYALAPNQTTGQNIPAVALIDLTTHSSPTNSASLTTASFDKLLVVSNTLAYAYASQTSSLYTITIPNLNIGAASITGIPAVSLTAAGASLDIAGGAHPLTQSLYLISSNNLVKLDIPSAQLGNPQPINPLIPSAAVVTLAGAANGNQSVPATLLQYGNSQTLATGATSLPLVVRVLDANGVPISGVTVTFSTTVAGAAIQTPTVTTGSNGFAMTTVTAPATSGQVTVTAAAGGLTQNFTLIVGTGGGGGVPTAGLKIVSGQGQIIFGNFSTAGGFGTPLTVQATDVNGSPLMNIPVTFTNTSGPAASLTFGPNGTDGGPTPDGNGRIVNTDVNGIASVNFLAPTVTVLGYAQTTVQATAPSTNSVTFYISSVSSNPSPTARFLPDPGTRITAPSGTTLKGAIQAVVVPPGASSIPNVGLRIVNPKDPSLPPNTPNTVSPVAHCNDTTGNGVLSDATTGLATCDLVITGNPGTYQISAEIGFLLTSQPYTLVITPGAPPTPATIQLSSTNLSGNAGGTITFSAKVLDANGSPLSGQTVTFQAATPGSIALSPTSAVSDSSGTATTTGKLGNTAGSFKVNVSSGSATAQLTFNVTIPITGISAVSGGNQSTSVSTQFTNQLVAQVTPAISGVQVIFTATNGAVVNPNTVTTDASGKASTTVTAGPSAGSVVVTASAAGSTATFNLTVLPPGPSNVTILNGASFQPGISPGSIAVIRGKSLLPGVVGQYSAFSPVGSLLNSLQGFSVTFNGIPAPIYYVSNQAGQEQVAVQVPFELAPGSATVVINTPGGGTATISNVAIQAVAPGLFETTFSGQNFAVATRPDGSFVSPANPALRGEVVCFYATGLGQTRPGIATNSVGVANQNVADAMDIGLNNAGVRLVSATTLQGLVGVYQVCMQVPQDPSNAGPRQPVGLIVRDPSGDFFAQGSFIPVQ